MARAAATSMSLLMSDARTSSAPRKMPGKASTLLIWFGVIAAARADHSRTGCGCLIRQDLRHRVGHGKHHGILCHGAHHLLRDDAGRRHAHEEIGALEGIGQRAGHTARIRAGGHLRMRLAQRGIARHENAVFIAEDQLAHAERQQELRDGGCRPRPTPFTTPRTSEGLRPVMRQALRKAAATTTAVPC